ncbi:unnamed protein product, partial [Iphiclides podalirius]
MRDATESRSPVPPSFAIGIRSTRADVLLFKHIPVVCGRRAGVAWWGCQQCRVAFDGMFFGAPVAVDAHMCGIMCGRKTK